MSNPCPSRESKSSIIRMRLVKISTASAMFSSAAVFSPIDMLEFSCIEDIWIALSNRIAIRSTHIFRSSLRSSGFKECKSSSFMASSIQRRAAIDEGCMSRGIKITPCPHSRRRPGRRLAQDPHRRYRQVRAGYPDLRALCADGRLSLHAIRPHMACTQGEHSRRTCI